MTAAHCLQLNEAGGDIAFVYDDITVVLGEMKIETSEKKSIFHTFFFLPRWLPLKQDYFKIFNISKIDHVIFPGEHDLKNDSETVTVVLKDKMRARKKHPLFYIRRAKGMWPF